MTFKSKQKKVLIVDDNKANLMLLENYLDGLDVECLKALSGYEALEILAEEKENIVLILLDIQMPGMDGFETAVEIRSKEATRYIPIIFITAMSSESYKFKGYESGAVDYINKPVDEDVLRFKVNVFIELYDQKKIIEKQREELRAKVEELQKALEEIKVLRGIIPICIHCKKIRDDAGFWENVERYIEKHSEVGFSHGICPDCLKEHFPEVADEILKEEKNDGVV